MKHILMNVLPVVGVLFVSTTHGAILYEEYLDSFSGAGSGYLPSQEGWNVHMNTNGKYASNSDTDSTFNALNTGGGNQARIVADAGAPSIPNRLFMYNDANAAGLRDYLVWTQEFSPIALAGYTDLVLSITQRNDAAGVGVRGVVRVTDGLAVDTWYAWSTTTTASTWTVTPFTLANANSWLSFSFDGDVGVQSSAFDVSGSPVSLPGTGSITAVGVYVEMLDERAFRMDNVVLEGTVIPEPGTLALVGISLGALLLFRRRRG